MTDEEILAMIAKYDTKDKLTWTDEECRIYSRIMEICLPVMVSGTDRRKEKIGKEGDELMRILKGEKNG